tara:strand:+ start:1046 stop:2422 length:1377 start_codon:yes stop_codon:yes gene_type:complete
MSFIIDLHKEVSQISTYQDVTLGTMKWGMSDSFPQTLVNFISQSANAYPAVSRAAQFYKGQGFLGEDRIVTPTGLTLKDIVSIMADDYANFRAFALHGNYNAKGKVSSIFPMRVPVLRFNQFDELNYASKVGYHPNFGLNSVEKKMITNQPTRGNIKWFDRFNPTEDIVAKQIEGKDGEGKLGNYNGQVLYFSEAGHSAYPISPLQAPINYLLSDIENSILVRKETSTGFTNSYLLKTSLAAEDEALERLQEEIYFSQGARGSGKIITFSDLSPEEISGTVLEEIGSGGSGAKTTIEAAILTYELSQKVITGAYLIPPVLAGINISNGFSGVDLEDAYGVFNAVTKPGRDVIEQQLNRMLAASEFSDVGPIKIIPLSINDKGAEELDAEKQTGEVPTGSPIERNPLTGRQEQALMRVVRNFNKGKMTRAQATDQLKNDLGLDEERIRVWIPEDNEENQ